MASNNYINQFILLTKSFFRLYLGVAISIFLFTLFFQPFTADEFEFENKLFFFAGFGIMALIVMISSQLLFQTTLLDKKNGIEGNVIKMPLYYFIQIAAASLAFLFYMRFVGQIGISLNIVVKVFFICSALPVALHLKITMNAYQARIKNILHESRELQDKQKQFSESYANKHIEISSDNESDNFRIQVSDIVYLKSADNYVEIGYHDEGLVKKKMVRNTLRNVEQQLSEFNNFIRTHRTCLVNIQYIDKLNKNFSSFWLSLEKTKETIPVSRSYLNAVKDLL